MRDLDNLKRLVATLPEAERRELLAFIRGTLPPHPMEERLLASSEELLEALARAPRLTIRMIRGVIAEAAFAVDALPKLGGRWIERRVVGDLPYDFLLTDVPPLPADPPYRPGADVRIQVKLQRSAAGRPLQADRQWRSRYAWPASHYVVEMQCTRSGERGGESTRPYRFGEFDILAVSLGPARGRWGDFMYTVERWLLPDPKNAGRILTFQPVAPADDDVWTSDFETCVGWWRSGITKRIA